MKAIWRTAVLILLACGWPTAASAQVKWNGIYVGPDMGGVFRTTTFTVADGSRPADSSPLQGTIGARFSVGLRAGGQRLVGHRIVIGGEVGVDYIAHHGDVSYDAQQGTTALTRSDLGWTALVRTGYPIHRLMPYFGFGLTEIPNTANVDQPCGRQCFLGSGFGSGNLSTRRWTYVIGGEWAMSQAMRDTGWTLRVEWEHIDGEPMVNTFSRSVLSSFPPTKTTASVTVNTPMPQGIVRVLISVRWGEW